MIRRDHYAPEGYLRGFIYPENSRNSRPLHVLGLPSRRWGRRAPRQIGYEVGFYFDPAGALTESLEDVFRPLENGLPRARSEVRQNGYHTWRQHQRAFVAFGAMLSVRSPLFFDQIRENIEREAHEGSDRTEAGRLNALAGMLRELESRADQWQSFDWALRYSEDPNDPVIATDQSVVAEGSRAEPDLEDPDLLIILPLAWDMCLFGSRKRPFDEECAKFCSEDLRRLRTQTIKGARRFIVSPVRFTGA